MCSPSWSVPSLIVTILLGSGSGRYVSVKGDMINDNKAKKVKVKLKEKGATAAGIAGRVQYHTVLD